MIDSGIEAGDLDDQFIQMDMNDDERMKLDLKKKVNISFKSWIRWTKNLSKNSIEVMLL